MEVEWDQEKKIIQKNTRQKRENKINICKIFDKSIKNKEMWCHCCEMRKCQYQEHFAEFTNDSISVLSASSLSDASLRGERMLTCL